MNRESPGTSERRAISLSVRLRTKRGRGWQYKEIEIPTDEEMLRVALELHGARSPAQTTCVGWPVLYLPLGSVSNSFTYCVFGYHCEWQVAYLWRDGEDQPPTKHPERGDVVPMPHETQGELFAPLESGRSSPLLEGRLGTVILSRHERCPEARLACIAHHGTACSVCGLDFEAAYGEIARGVIHVHHLEALANADDEREVDPVLDLRPVCPNCHVVLHLASPPLTIEEARGLLRADHCELRERHLSEYQSPTRGPRIASRTCGR